jgi:hypothetical protein
VCVGALNTEIDEMILPLQNHHNLNILGGVKNLKSSEVVRLRAGIDYFFDVLRRSTSSKLDEWIGSDGTEPSIGIKGRFRTEICG